MGCWMPSIFVTRVSSTILLIGMSLSEKNGEFPRPFGASGLPYMGPPRPPHTHTTHPHPPKGHSPSAINSFTVAYFSWHAASVVSVTQTIACVFLLPSPALPSPFSSSSSPLCPSLAAVLLISVWGDVTKTNNNTDNPTTKKKQASAQ